ncbi:MAG: PKD domain-containing protein [Candidatus Thermoplasmatota archaeon]|nr:PKD domain-containing protein [Candidatus Thermoplasmatota archaeon]
MRKHRIIIGLILAFFLAQSFNGWNPNISSERGRALGDSSDNMEQDTGIISPPSQQRSNEPVMFINVSPAAGLSGIRGDNLAWGDYNNDGYIDLLVRGNISSGTMLFENQGPPSFDFLEVTDQVGIDCRGYSIWGDYDNDGNLDFFCADRGDTLWHNEGPPDYHFTNATSEEMYFKDGAPSEAAAWVDYDNDGYLDIFCTCWVKDGYNQYNWPNWGMPDHLWHNNGDGSFTDVTVESGIYRNNPAYAAMSIAVCDYNDDGWQDIYVGNYHLCPNYLWENQGDGTFRNVAGPQDADVDGDADYYQNSGPYYGHSPGAAWGDFDNDLDMDLWVSNLAHKDDERSGMNRGAFCDDSQLLESSGAPDYHFQDIRAEVGIPITPSGTVISDDEGNDYWKDEDYFGCTWGDYDNDGDLDLWIPQIKTYSFWDWCFLWRNNGDRTFSDQAENLGIRVWSNSGASWGDYDNDGDLDLITEGTVPFKGGRELHLFRNEGNSNNWLELELKGTTANAGAIGARVILTVGDTHMSRIIGGDAGGHGFQNSPIVHFGLGDTQTIDRIEIRWPDRTSSELFNVDAGQRLVITQGEAPVIQSLSVIPGDPHEDEQITASLVTAAPLVSGNYVVQWDLDNDGSFEHEETPVMNGEVLSPTFSLGVTGDYNISARLYDSVSNQGDSMTMAFKVSNLPPAADAGPDLTAAEDSIVVFNGSESFDTSSDLTAGLEFRWVFGDGGSTQWRNSPLAARAYPEKGNYLVTLEVRDNDDSINTDKLNVTVYNVVPTASAPSTLIGVEDYPLAFSGSGQDTENDTDELEFRWDFGDGIRTDWAQYPEMEHTYRQAGNYSAILSVMDWDMDIGTFIVNVSINNLLPEGTFDISLDTVYEDDEIKFTAYGEDTKSDEDDLKFRMDYGDGNTSEWQYENDFIHTFNYSGAYRVKLFIKDNSNGTYNYSRSYSILNQIPEARISYSPKRELDKLTEIIFSAAGTMDTESDMDGLNFTWNMGREKTLWGETVSYIFLGSGAHDVKLTVRDDDGDTGTISQKLNIENTLPEAVINVSTRELSVGEKILLDGTFSVDTAGDMEGLEYLWEIGSIFKTGITAEHTFTKPGTYTITLTVTDADDGSDEKSVTISVTETTGDQNEEINEGLGKSKWMWITLASVAVLVAVGIILVLIIKRGVRKEKEMFRNDESQFAYDKEELNVTTPAFPPGTPNSIMAYPEPLPSLAPLPPLSVPPHSLTLPAVGKPTEEILSLPPLSVLAAPIPSRKVKRIKKITRNR